MSAIGRPTGTLPAFIHRFLAMGGPPPSYAVQLPLITFGPRANLPPGLQASRTRIAVSGLDSLLTRLTNIAMRISRYPDVVLFDAVVATSQDLAETLVAVRGLNIQHSFVPVFRNAAVRAGGGKDARPIANRTSYDDDTICAVFDRDGLRHWLADYDVKNPPAALQSITDAGVKFLPASALPISLRDTVTGKRVRGVRTRP